MKSVHKNPLETLRRRRRSLSHHPPALQHSPRAIAEAKRRPRSHSCSVRVDAYLCVGDGDVCVVNGLGRAERDLVCLGWRVGGVWLECEWGEELGVLVSFCGVGVGVWGGEFDAVGFDCYGSEF